MKLTSYTNYALRSLQLAALKDPELIRVDDVIRVHGLARPHIVKIVHQLGVAGYLSTQRGRNGGFRLAKLAEEIIIGDVVRLTEGPLDLVECFDPEKNTCPLIGVCKLSRAMQEATRAFMAVLDDLTLADIAANRDELFSRITPIEEGILAPVRKKEMNVDWTERFQGTSALPGHVRGRLVNVARILRLQEGAQVFGPTNIPDSLFFLYDGRIRVSQSSDTGREITLYRVDAGESCVLTTACMLAEEAYSAEGVAETDITLVALPKLAFDQLVSEEAAFRDFVLAAYSKRLIDLLRVVDDVAFGHMDVRLAERLLVIAGDRKEIAATHQHLASELGTAREVVSRVLSDFQKRQIVGQSRGRIALIDKKALKELASKH